MPVTEARPSEKRIQGLPGFFKDLPPLDEAPAYLYGWLAGYFAADGTVSGTSAVLTCADREVLEFVQTLCTRIGIVTYPIGVHKRNAGSYKPDGGDYFYLNFRSADLPPEFFLLPSHRERWERTKRGSGISHDIWRVVSVEPTDRVEEVYCAVVEGEAAFTLDGFIATGNCHIRDKDARAGTTTGWAHDRVRRETIKDWSALTENLQRRWLKEDLADRDDQTKRKFAAALRSALLDIDPSIAGQLRDNLAAELAHVGL